MQNNGFRRLRTALYGSTSLATMAVIVFTTTGCAGYRLGSMLPPDIQTVHVAMFANHTSEPQLEGTTTSAVIAEFQRDATLRVVNKGSDADTRLDVELIRFSVQPLRYDRNRPRAADEYRITIRAKLVFRRVSTGVALVEKEVEGDSTFVVTGDLTSAKRAATPAAARDLAHDIVESVVESW